jgi:soluble lytic murein transglycosylase
MIGNYPNSPLYIGWKVKSRRRFRGLPWVVIAILATIFIADRTPVRAGIYRYVDGNGVIHFSNVPTNGEYALYIKEDGDIDFKQYGEAEFDHLIEEAAGNYGVDPALIKAIIRTESDFNPRAVSRAGAMGLMQLMPETADDLSVIDAFDPIENIDAGVRHFRELLETFENDLNLSLAAYNAGRTAVLQFNSIPPYAETQRYVKKVLHFYGAYKQ